MTKSNANRIILRKVHISLFLIPVAIPLFFLFIALGNSAGWNIGEGSHTALVSLIFLGLIYGAIIWIPTIIACLLIERIPFEQKPTIKSVIILLTIETILAIAIISYIFSGELFLDGVTGPLALAIISTQLLRWWYLNYKRRVYMDETITNSDDTVLDDLNNEL